ncbi:hypothetical protein R3Q06_32330 [Rhodococcus erythropolis]|uniref:hypothetical protein n=1 Tax=Rhodococcus erythropolis TaxID=1833 RepID=UPI00294A318F|nr:hypothetical protein [Rhodococcus erythropolis]MDV6278160.1 hypothetical protein [Rhodococcus erythropolis]
MGECCVQWWWWWGNPTPRAIERPVTTDTEMIARILRSTERQLIVAATYASSNAVAEA